MKNTKTLWVYLGIAATALLTLLPFFSVGVTTSDDLQYLNTAQYSWKHWMADAKIYAEGAGRFYFYVTKVFYYVPYLIDSFAYTKAVQYITLMACYCLFAYLVYRLFHSRNLALLTLLLIIFDTTLTPNNHIPTIAYPFYFSFSIIIFITALLLYINYTERGGYWRVILSASLFLVAYLFYETYLLFALVFGALVVVRHLRRNGARLLSSRDFWRETVPYILTALLYVGCYWGYRQWLLATMTDKTFYDGAAFSMETFSIDGFFKVLWRCTRAAFPGESFFENRWLLVENSQLIAGHRNNLWQVLTHAPAIVWVNALLQGVLMWFLTRPGGFKTLRGRRILCGIAISIFVAFFAHTLIGIATKYNLDWCNWMRGYVTTIYSILALMLALALLIAAIILISRNHILQLAIRILLCTITIILSVAVGYTNHHISREWSRSQHRMKLIDMIGKSNYFDTLPADAVIYTEELRNTSGFAYDVSKGGDLENYINRRAGRSFHYVTDSTGLAGVPADKPLYYLHAIETKKACELLVSISLLDSVRSANPADLTASHADVFYLSPCKKYTVFYQAGGIWKALPYDSMKYNMRLTQVSLADSAISPRTIIISDMVLPQ